MLDEVRSLLILQDRDRRLLTIAKDLEKLPSEESRARGKLAGDQQALATAKEAVQKCEIKLKNLELDVGTRKTTIARLKVQQFETRKNEEYQAIANEIVRYEKEVDNLETLELELMEQIDQNKVTLAQAEKSLTQTSKLVDEDIEGITQRKAKLEALRTEILEERAKLAANIAEGTLPLYDRLMKTKNGLALASMHEGKCDGCHMKLIPSTVVAVQNGKELSRCEDCGRILYLEE